MTLKDSKMTRAERLEALVTGNPVDRVPFFSFTLGFCARNVGYPLSAIYRDPEKSFGAQSLTREQYDYDSDPFYGYASYGGWEFGGEIKLPESEYEQAPSHGRFAVETESDVAKLKTPDVRTAGMLPLAMQFSQLQMKNNLSPSLVVGGPFTIAGNICPVETLCRWLIRKPELANRLIQLAANHILEVVEYWVKTFGPGRVILQIWEPLASNQIISPGQFEKFILPYQIELHQKILSTHIRYLLCHICGEQNLNLPYWSQVPMGEPGFISIGSQIDILKAISYFGKTNVIAGNIEPAVLQTGTPPEIYELCRQAIVKGKSAPRGYILMQGCEVPVNTPPYNLYIMRKAVDDFGWY
jgi:uroporphyrinogen decarboxylase